MSVLLTLTLTLSGCGVTSSNRPGAVVSQTTSVNSATATTSPPAGSTGFGVIAFQGSFYQTTDGGGHWSAANTPALPTAAEPVNFELGAANRWIAATQFGATSATITVVRSNDSGASWQTSTITDIKDSYARPLSLQFTDAQHGWLAVDESQGNIRVGSLYGTSDGGASWTSFALPFSGDVTFTSQTDGWLVGGKFSTLRDMVAVTHDGGQIWTRQQVVATPAQGYNPILGSPTFFDA